MREARLRTLSGSIVAILAVGALFPARVMAQDGHKHPKPATTSDSAHVHGMADHAMSGAMTKNMMKHMELSPVRPATHDDSVRATKLAAELRQAVARYRDTAAATADGYKMFLPNLKEQRVYHFTNYKYAALAAFRFNPEKPSSILYRRDTNGTLKLIGAMYTMPKNASPERLNDRVPLSIARWHKHVNWCLPKKGESARVLEKTKDGEPKFGPESPIATKAECDAVNGDFHANLFGWMVHANVFDGPDLRAIWGDDHGGHSP